MQRAISADTVSIQQDSQSSAWVPLGTLGYKNPSELDRSWAGCRGGAADTEKKDLTPEFDFWI